MSYEINVALRGKHYLATGTRSIGYDKTKLVIILKQFKEMYPESEGYKITVDNCEEISTPVDFQKIIDDQDCLNDIN